jgi:hypothetical protein
MVLPIDPRKSQDPIASRSSQSRLLIDMLTEGIVFNLASATASNYNSDKYGPNHRILYESVARITASLIVDALDLNEDSEFSSMRPEYLNSKLLYLIFDEGEEPLFEGADDLRDKLSKTVKALTKGTTLESVQGLLNEAVNTYLDVNISVNSNHKINTLSRLFASTEVSESHRHVVYAGLKGIGKTSAKIGAYWGDDRHIHEVIDGVVQSAVDENGVSHTHDIIFGIDSNTLNNQENIRRLINVSKPAHVSLKENSSLLEEDIDEPSFNMDLSLGMSFQDDNRRAREGTIPSSFYVHSNGTKVLASHKFNGLKPSDTVIIKPDSTSTEQVRRRVVEIREGDPIPDGDYTFRSLRLYLPILNPNYVESVLWNTIAFSVVNGRLSVDRGGAPDFFSAHRDGEPLTAVSVGTGQEYVVFIEKVHNQSSLGFLDPLDIACNLVRREIVLDVPVEEGLVYLINQDSDHINSQVSYKELSFTYNYHISPSPLVGVDSDYGQLFPEDVRESIDGLPAIADDFQLYINGVNVRDLVPAGGDLIAHYFGPGVILNSGERSISFYVHSDPTTNIVQNGDVITLRYPYGELQETGFYALNRREYVLNSVRPLALGLAQSNLNNAGGQYLKSVRPLVLLPPQDIIPARVLRREVTSGLLGTDVLNTGVIGLSFTLNSFDNDVNVPRNKVFAPATSTVIVNNGKINIAEVGFTPRDLVSILDSSNNSYTGIISRGFILLSNPPEDGTEVTLTAISTEPFTDEGDWFTLDSRSEGQAPFVSDPITPYPSIPTADDIMANPQGSPLTQPAQDSPRRVSGKVSESTEGVSGELKFFDDVITEIALSGNPFNDANGLLSEEVLGTEYSQIAPENHQVSWFTEDVYRSHFIAGGRNGSVVYEESILNDRFILTTNEKAPMTQVRFCLY